MNKYMLASVLSVLALPAYADVENFINAAKENNVIQVQSFLAHGENINAKNSLGNTALHYAVATGSADMVKFLLDKGADPTIANDKGWTPVAIAEKKNLTEIMSIFNTKKPVNMDKVIPQGMPRPEDIAKAMPQPDMPQGMPRPEDIAKAMPQPNMPQGMPKPEDMAKAMPQPDMPQGMPKPEDMAKAMPQPDMPQGMPRPEDMAKAMPQPNIPQGMQGGAVKPEVKAEVKPEVKAEAKPEVKAEAKPEVKAEVKPEVKAEAKPEVKAEAKPEVKAEAKPEVKAEAKPEVKAEVKPEVKAEAKPEVKAEVKPEVKAEVKPEVKAEAKPEVKAEAKPTPTPAPKHIISPVKAKPLPKLVPSTINKEIFAGDEEIVYCLYYLGLQTEQHNLTSAAEYFAGTTVMNKARFDKIAELAHQYYDNASEAEMKNMADVCAKVITPKNADKQNQIIRAMNKAIGY